MATVLALASVAYGQTNADDVTALAGLQKCVQAASSNIAYVNGWGVQGFTGRKLLQGTTPAQLCALGVPGTCGPTPTTPTGTATTAPASIPTGTSATSPCGDASNPVPWTGLLCSGGRVTQVLISTFGAGKNGPIFGGNCDVSTLADLAGLSAATIVDFTNAGLKGTLPASWSTGAWSNSLTSLTLAQNPGLVSLLPPEWGSGFSALQTLNIASSGLTGAVPPSWGTATAFPALINLQLISNNLGGGLPGWTSGFPKLQLLGLGENQLTGTLPAWSFPALSTLELQQNKLVGCLPSAWPTGLPKLGSLNVANNSLSGEIPSSWDTWASLNTSTLTPGNDFCGSISSTFRATPDGKGVRLQPDITSLPACSGVSCSTLPTLATAPAPALAPAGASSGAASPGLPTLATAGRR